MWTKKDINKLNNSIDTLMKQSIVKDTDRKRLFSYDEAKRK